VALALIAIITVVVISAWKTSGSSPHVAKQAAPPTQTRAHVTAAAAHAASAPAVRHVTRHVAALPSQPLRPRARLSVLVLNGNGVKGAAGAKAVSLQTLGYGSSHSENAPRHDYARSMVMYLPGYAQEARTPRPRRRRPHRRDARRDAPGAAQGVAARGRPRGQLGGQMPWALWRAWSRGPHGVPVGPNRLYVQALLNAS